MKPRKRTTRTKTTRSSSASHPVTVRVNAPVHLSRTSPHAPAPSVSPAASAGKAVRESRDHFQPLVSTVVTSCVEGRAGRGIIGRLFHPGSEDVPSRIGTPLG